MAITSGLVVLVIITPGAIRDNSIDADVTVDLSTTFFSVAFKVPVTTEIGSPETLTTQISLSYVNIVA